MVNPVNKGICRNYKERAAYTDDDINYFFLQAAESTGDFFFFLRYCVLKKKKIFCSNRHFIKITLVTCSR